MTWNLLCQCITLFFIKNKNLQVRRYLKHIIENVLPLSIIKYFFFLSIQLLNTLKDETFQILNLIFGSI